MAKGKWIILIIAIIILAYLSPPNNNYPVDMINKVNELSRMHPNDLDFARATFTFVVDRWKSPIRAYLKEPSKPFLKDMMVIWNIPNGDYQSSNVESDLLKRMLILSNRFKDEDIRITRGFCEISPHSYIEINIRTENITFFMDTWLEDRDMCQIESCFGQATTIPCGPENIIGEKINDIQKWT